MSSLKLHKVLYLYKTFSKFYIQPVEEANEALIIDRHTNEITLNSMFSVSLLPANATSCLIYGIVGIKYLISCPYLIVITKATQIGLIKGQPIYRMDQAQVIPFNPNVAQLHSSSGSSNANQIAGWNNTYVSMLESVLQMPNFYFSYSYDLTNSTQRTNRNQSDLNMATATSAHQSYDKRFLWNGQLMDDFDRCGKVTDRYRLPFILGFVSINPVHLGCELSWIIVSRRSVKRAGTRFNCRGIDHDGNVANFVETEQIVEQHMNGNIIQVASFVQVRGSIPLLWSQYCQNYAYRPPIVIETSYEHKTLMARHFTELNQYYGNISVVNLIDKRGREGKLEHEFSQRMAELHRETNSPWPIYHYFDFHKECSKMRWHRLNILLDSLQQEIESFGYFAANGDQVMQEQNGVIRSNCIDSLDRTNVVQSMIAQRVLEIQLQNFKILTMGTRLTDFKPFMQVFKNTWADNADKLSIQYAGTPALKTDFTRTGQRTSKGMVKDGVNSLTRYFTNNFFDDYRQDAIDLFLGNFEGYPSPKYRHMDLTSTIPFTIVVLTFVLLYIYLRY